MHLNVIRESVDADLGKMHSRCAVNAERHVELDGSGVEPVEVGVVQVAGLQRRRDVCGDESEILCLAHDVDRDLAVFDRGHRDTAQPPVGRRAIVRDPLVVEPRKSRGEFGVFKSRRTEAEARIQHHRVDLIAVGVAEHTLRGGVVDAVRCGKAVLTGTAGARAVGLGIVTALDDQRATVGARRDLFGPASHRLDR